MVVKKREAREAASQARIIGRALRQTWKDRTARTQRPSGPHMDDCGSRSSQIRQRNKHTDTYITLQRLLLQCIRREEQTHVMSSRHLDTTTEVKPADERLATRSSLSDLNKKLFIGILGRKEGGKLEKITLDEKGIPISNKTGFMRSRETYY